MFSLFAVTAWIAIVVAVLFARFVAPSLVIGWRRKRLLAPLVGDPRVDIDELVFRDGGVALSVSLQLNAVEIRGAVQHAFARKSYRTQNGKWWAPGRPDDPVIAAAIDAVMKAGAGGVAIDGKSIRVSGRPPRSGDVLLDILERTRDLVRALRGEGPAREDAQLALEAPSAADVVGASSGTPIGIPLR